MRKSFRKTLVVSSVVVVAAAGSLLWMLKGTGAKTRLAEAMFPEEPLVRRTRPADGEAGVLQNEFVAADVHLPFFGHGVDPKSLGDGTVTLWRRGDGRSVPAVINTSAAGDAIVLQPTELLEPGSEYTFEVTSGVRDTKGTPFKPHRSTFKTSDVVRTEQFPAAFDKVALDHAEGVYTGLTFGPDGKLYGCTYDGKIVRWTINDADGTFTAGEEIDTVRAANGGPRLIVGIAFDPASTAAEPILWLTHGVLMEKDAPDWTSRLSRLSGPNLERYQDVVVGLPRSYRDHLSNQPTFGPDGCLYFVQGSNTATGAAVENWGGRHERLLSAAMLRVDPRLITRPPLDVRPGAHGQARASGYDPFAPGAAVTLYATGIRLGFDALWHSSGHLFTAVNGSAAGGNTPATPPEYEYNDIDAGWRNRLDVRARGTFRAPPVAPLQNIRARPDYLFRVEPGGFYGHPNPRRGEYILDGGNPTAGADVAEVGEYPIGTRPDRNWRPPALVFGKNVSPNGMIEYQSDAFGGVLRGRILVCRYSGGDDVVALTVNPAGEVTEVVVGIEGLGKFLDPLDLAHDPRTGRIYVAEYEGRRLTLARPRVGPPTVAFSRNTFRMSVSQATRSMLR